MAKAAATKQVPEEKKVRATRKKVRDTSNLGRPTIGEERMTPKEARARFVSNLVDGGGRILTLRVRDADAVQALSQLTASKGFKSDTAAATWLLTEALKKMGKSMASKAGK